MNNSTAGLGRVFTLADIEMAKAHMEMTCAKLRSGAFVLVMSDKAPKELIDQATELGIVVELSPHMVKDKMAIFDSSSSFAQHFTRNFPYPGWQQDESILENVKEAMDGGHHKNE